MRQVSEILRLTFEGSLPSREVVRFGRVLATVLDNGLEAVEATVREALLVGVTSEDVILNILARRREPPRPLTILTPEDPPRTDCGRHNSLRGLHAAA